VGVESGWHICVTNLLKATQSARNKATESTYKATEPKSAMPIHIFDSFRNIYLIVSEISTLIYDFLKFGEFVGKVGVENFFWINRQVLTRLIHSAKIIF